MNILPFVFTFLLLLTCLSSFMFTSIFRTVREKEVVLTEHQAYLSVISKQNKDRFGKIRSPKKEKTPPPTEPSDPQEEEDDDRQTELANKIEQDYRDIQMGCEGSKINLWPMIHDPSSQLSLALQKTLVRLLQILYEPYPFYKIESKKDIAQEIVNAMIEQKIKSLEKLQFKDPELDRIYYTMMKGTNTAYPPLTEYCRLKNESTPPIHFRFTSKPVIRAALGEELAQKVFSLEKENHAKNTRVHALKKPVFLDLAKTHPTSWIQYDLLTVLFKFQNEKKGLLQLTPREKFKIRAFHEDTSEKNAKN